MTFLLCVAEKVLDGLFQHPARLKNASLLPLDFLSAFICGFTVARLKIAFFSAPPRLCGEN